MKNIISLIISIGIFVAILPPVISFADDINYPEAGNEYGYIFMLKDKSENIDIEKYPNIEMITSALAKIYYAADIYDIKSISDIYDIEYVEQNVPLYKPEPIDTEDEVSLYSLEDENISLFAESMSTDESVDTPEATEIPTETAVPIVNDPLYQYQWSHEAVKAKAFWENGITGDGIKVGVIDTGINREHSAFNGVNIETGINVCAYVAKDEENLYDTTDTDGHGTVVTSIICSTINDGIGMAGLTDKVTIVPYKIHDSNYAAYIDGAAFLRAIDLAYQDNCDVLNISQGGTTRYDIEEQLINQAVQQGMIICAAVGNSGYGDSPVEYPANYENVIGVGGVEPANCEEISVRKNKNTGEILGLKDDVLATFSNGYSEKYDLYLSDLVGNYQYTIDAVADIPENSYTRWGMSTANESVFISAPANLLVDANYKNVDYYNTTSSGTSVATPIVAAAAAGVKQMRPYVDTDMFKEILMATAVDLEDEGYDINTGYGMVNFERIYDYVSQMPLTAPERTPEVTIDYENEQLTDFPINRSYTINGEYVIVSEDGTLPIAEEWFGTEIEIVKKASSDAYTDSEPQLLYIPAREELPDTVYGTETGITNDSGIAILYKPINSEEWTRCDSSILLTKGKYLVKTVATSSSFGSVEKELYVGKKDVGIEINYQDETLINFEDGENYTINGQDITIENNIYLIDNAWLGTTISITRKASNTNDEDITQELTIPEKPKAPENISGDKGKLIGTTADMEYCKQDGKQWINCSDGTTLLGSSAGVYQVRIKQSDNRFASEIAIVQVGLAIPMAEIDYQNEMLKSFEAEESYTINGQDVEINNKTCPIEEEWLGKTVSIMRKASSRYMNDSEPQLLYIPERPDIPNIVLFNDNTVNIVSGIVYKEENSDNWQTNDSDNTITLEPGKTYVFKVQYTENSFASNIKQITVQFADTEQYDIETSIAYNPDNGECTYSAINNTIWTVNAVGIIAVYTQNGVLKHLETIDEFPAECINKKLNFTLTEGDRVKFFVWDSLQSMKPKDRVKKSECIVTFDKTE